MNHEFPYKWTLKNAVFTKDKGKVFSCFACGGGSTMGYKLAGFDVLGCNEIDPKMIEAYKVNHNPKYAFLESIQTFKMRNDLPEELYNLDILDGSPPCSSFSMAGNREKDWGKQKKFREGQAEQILDNLFFDFIDLAKKLQPKIVVAENVKGLLLGNAKDYVRRIYREFDLAGYYVQHWLLNASKMGVPQRRERVFFIAMRKDLAKPFLKQIDLFTILPELKLQFNEKNILFGEYRSKKGSKTKITERQKLLLDKYNEKKDYTFADIMKRTGHKKPCGFTDYIINDNITPFTLTAGGKTFRAFDKKWFSENDYKLTGSFPIDYNFCKNKCVYLIGMSVPPVMMAQIAKQIYIQWISKF